MGKFAFLHSVGIFDFTNKKIKQDISVNSTGDEEINSTASIDITFIHNKIIKRFEWIAFIAMIINGWVLLESKIFTIKPKVNLTLNIYF